MKELIKQHNRLIRELDTARLRATREKDKEAAQLLWNVFKLKAREVRDFVEENPDVIAVLEK